MLLPSGGDSPQTAVLHRQSPSPQHILDGDGYSGLLPPPRQWRKSILQDHSAAGILRLPHHRLRHAASHRHWHPSHW